MRVVVTGATGNIGTSFIDACAGDPDIDIVGVARRIPTDGDRRGVDWVAADVAHDDVTPIVRGADVVVHCAWSIQARVAEVMPRTNVDGSARVFAAAAAERAAIIHLSSIGAYSPGPSPAFARVVDESWPTGGVAGSRYSQQKVQCERMLDQIEADFPSVRVVRVRPALVLKPEAATEIHDLFLGVALPRLLVPPGAFARALAHIPLALQVVHSADVGEALRLLVHSDLRGALNLATDPVVGRAPKPRRSLFALRGLTAALHAVRIVPSEPGWIDLAREAPVIDTTRARTELGWQPRWNAYETIGALLDGMRAGRSDTTPALAPGGVDRAIPFDRITA